MATRGVKPQQPGQLCDYCHQKRRYANHRYCSKTCANQAGQPSAPVNNNNNNLCIQCQAKPKFRGFDFCGKSCAAAANSQGGKATGPGQRPKGINPSNNQQPAFNPVQVAQFVAQQVPQVKAFLAALNSSAPPPQQAPLPPANQAIAPQNNPFLQPQAPAAFPMNGTPAASSSLLFAAQPGPASPQSPQSATDDTECLIPGCGKPVHVDAKGMKTSDYCSQRHREEAVTSGLVDPCIMCLKLPQTERDYFCSRACREDALEKLPE